MSTKYTKYCDICRKQITPGDSFNGHVISGHASYRVWSDQFGQKGEKLDLCANHAYLIYDYIQTIKEVYSEELTGLHRDAPEGEGERANGH